MGQLQVTAQEYFDKAFHFEKTGQLSEAENALSSCLAHRLEAFGSDNHDHVVSALNSLGKLHIMCQQPQIAVPLLKRAVAAAAIVHGEMNAENQLPSLVLLATALQQQKLQVLNSSSTDGDEKSAEFDQASELLDRAEQITARKFPAADHPQKARRLEERAMLLHSRKSVEAYATFEAVLDMRRRIYGDDARYFELLDQTLVPNTVESDEVDIPHPELCLAYCHLGMNAFASGRFEQALHALQRSTHLQLVHSESYGLPPNFAVHEALIACLLRLGRHKEAEQSAHFASSLCKSRYGSKHPAYVLAQLNEATALQYCALQGELDHAHDTSSAQHSFREELDSRAIHLLMEAFEQGSEQYGLVHNVTLKAAIDLSDLLINRQGFRESFTLANDLLLAGADDLPSIDDASTSIAPSASPSAASPSLVSTVPSATTPLPRLVDWPFMSIYPSFTCPSRPALVAQLYRIRAQCHQQRRHSEQHSEQHSGEDRASQYGQLDARRDCERALSLLTGPAEMAPRQHTVRALQDMLTKLKEG